MSGNDGQEIVTTVAVIVMTNTTATTDENTESSDGSQIKHVCRHIYVDMAFVKSFFGFLMIVEFVLPLAGMFCIYVPKRKENCRSLFDHEYIVYQFAVVYDIAYSLGWYIVYSLAINKKYGLRCGILEARLHGFTAFVYLIGASLVATNTCSEDGFKAAAAIGFVIMLIRSYHCYLRYVAKDEAEDIRAT